jgi:hypothetical protein
LLLGIAVTADPKLEDVYAEVKRMRIELKSLEKSLNTIADMLIPEEKASPKELEELDVLKNEALKGECVPFEQVLKKHGAKKNA